jgi:hypothetical protein
MNAERDRLRAAFDLGTADLTAFVQEATPDEWATYSPPEDATVAAVIHHVVIWMDPQLDLVQRLAAGRILLPWSRETINAYNAWHFPAHAAVSREETLALLDRNAAQVRAFLDQVTAEQLRQSLPGDRIVLSRPAGQMTTAAQLFQSMLNNHFAEHFGNISLALGRQVGRLDYR